MSAIHAFEKLVRDLEDNHTLSVDALSVTAEMLQEERDKNPEAFTATEELDATTQLVAFLEQELPDGVRTLINALHFAEYIENQVRADVDTGDHDDLLDFMDWDGYAELVAGRHTEITWENPRGWAVFDGDWYYLQP